MQTESEYLSEIKRLCILNFIELQEIKRRLNISTKGNPDYEEYAGHVSDYLNEMDEKMRNLIRDRPHLLDEK